MVEAGGQVGESSIGRRSFLKKAAAVGVVAWTAPVITASKVAAQTAGTGETIAPNTCYKFQYNWLFNVKDNGSVTPVDNTNDNLMLKRTAQTPSYPARWHEECQFSDNDGVHLAGWTTNAGPITERYKSNGEAPNGQCCKDSTPRVDGGLGQEWDWWQSTPAAGAHPGGAERILTFPLPDCVTIDPVCGAPGTGDGFTSPETITFTLPATHPQCGTCFFADPVLVYTTNTSSLSLGVGDQGGRRSKVITVKFQEGSSRWPIYLKTWIACGPDAVKVSCTVQDIDLT